MPDRQVIEGHLEDSADVDVSPKRARGTVTVSDRKMTRGSRERRGLTTEISQSRLAKRAATGQPLVRGTFSGTSFSKRRG